eukprot:1840802-Heterocapsa_arctica.AAC.1
MESSSVGRRCGRWGFSECRGSNGLHGGNCKRRQKERESEREPGGQKDQAHHKQSQASGCGQPAFGRRHASSTRGRGSTGSTGGAGAGQGTLVFLCFIMMCLMPHMNITRSYFGPSCPEEEAINQLQHGK